MPQSEVIYLHFSLAQCQYLASASQTLAELGGPEEKGVARHARLLAGQLAKTLSTKQHSLLKRYIEGHVSALFFKGMPCIEHPIPTHLPNMSILANSPGCRYLSSRNLLLLELAQHRGFAFDIDNGGKQVRLVGNFKGGGRTPLRDEDSSSPIETSSHAGLSLGPHTEAPYHCSTISTSDHSPAPSALILTACWNPADEPTYVFPLQRILERLGSLDTLALTSPSFDFTRSDCFAFGQGKAGEATSLLQFEPNGGFSIRYNSYRFSLNKYASSAAAHAFDRFKKLLNDMQPIEFILQPDCALLINNSKALHGRDALLDNRRLLIRQFGYSSVAAPLILTEDPLLVRG